MKGTTKVIISFGVAIAIVATILVVALMDKGDQGTDKAPYQLQSTTTTLPGNTDSWININDLANDLATATDPSQAPETTILPDGSVVIITTTQPGVSYIYVDPDGNVVNPSDVNNPITQPQTTAPQDDPITTTTTPIEGDTIPDSGNSGDTDIQLSEYEIDSKTGYITKYNGSGGYVNVPEKINGVSVKGIGVSAFAGTAVSHLDIGTHITYIGDRAFENCQSLTSVVFAKGTSPVTIGFRAFSGCLKLKTVTLPVCKVLGQSAFENCTALTKVEMAAGSQEIGRACFFNCLALKSAYIPDSVLVIGDDAFKNCNREILTVYTPVGSDAETYATNAGINTAPYNPKY